MPTFLHKSKLVLLLLAALLVGWWLGDGRSPAQLWVAFTSSLQPDPALTASLPKPDPSQLASYNPTAPGKALPESPLNDLLRPGLTPLQQTDIIGQMLLDYWTTTKSLPNGTWEEVCEQLAGNNKAKLTLVPSGHPALGAGGFQPGKDQPSIHLHVVSSSGAAFQLIYSGPDGILHTDDDQTRNFPPDLDF